MSESIMERLRYHAQDMYNTAFSRSTMREAEAEIATLRAQLAAAEARAERYRAAFDWMQRQDLDDLTMQLVVDAEHDGQYFVRGDSNKPGYGPTLLDAVESAALAEGEAG